MWVITYKKASPLCTCPFAPGESSGSQARVRRKTLIGWSQGCPSSRNGTTCATTTLGDFFCNAGFGKESKFAYSLRSCEKTEISQDAFAANHQKDVTEQMWICQKRLGCKPRMTSEISRQVNISSDVVLIMGVGYIFATSG